jgi:hypothetical protein
MSSLRAVVVIDYQNVHLTAHSHFRPDYPIHDALICPGAFARVLIDIRNRTSHLSADLTGVQVYRGLPEPEHDFLGYQRNLAQQQRWESDPLVAVTHIPLRYRVIRQCYSTGGPGGAEPEVEVQEKGLDVLCALAVVSAAARSDVDLVVLATHDRDLDPAVSAVQHAATARIEGFQWYGGRGKPTGRLRGDGHLWCTRIDEDGFTASRDIHDYSASKVLASRPVGCSVANGLQEVR